tara:strand:- start:174 stop:950 length:777 start_codon:yes stop_codon:yes gene_type:complete
MGETAKILSPDKRVLMPTLEATCSLDEGCPSDDFKTWKSHHPDRTVVVYANTSAAIKAQADWVVTSSIALEVVQHLHERGQSILWAPDQHLGRYVQHKTGADMKLWEGECIVHREFQAQSLIDLKARHPEAAILVHPESPLNVIELADVVGSTQHLLSAVQSRSEKIFIVATDQGLFYAMQAAAPDKQLILAPTTGRHATCQACGSCPWMQMNSVEKIEEVFNQPGHEIYLDEALIDRASRPLARMLSFKNNYLNRQL